MLTLHGNNLFLYDNIIIHINWSSVNRNMTLIRTNWTFKNKHGKTQSEYGIFDLNFFNGHQC